MNELLIKLNTLLLNKKYGKRENEIIIQTFDILSKYYENDSEKLMEFIINIEKFKHFKIVTDVNGDAEFKNKVRYVDKSELEKLKMYKDLFGSKICFKKIGEQYIQDASGEYMLIGWGYKSKEGDLFVFDTDQTLSTFIHEYEHTTQLGFKINMNYIGSYEFTGSSYFRDMFREGDATRLQLLSSLSENFSRIVDNKITYFGEFHIFNYFLTIMGENFMEKWKGDSNENEDYFKQIRNWFDNIDKEETLLKTQSLLYFFRHIKLMSDEMLSQNLHTYQEINRDNEAEFLYFSEEKKSLENLNKCPESGEYIQRGYNISQQALDASQHSILVIKEVMSRYQEYKNLTDQEKKCYLHNMMLEIEMLFEDSFQGNMSNKSPNLEFLNWYYIFLLSSFKVNDGNYGLNETNELLIRKKELLNKLNTCRLITLKTILDSTATNDFGLVSKMVTELQHLNELKIQLGFANQTEKNIKF